MKGFLFNGKDENTTYGSFSGAAAGKAGTSGLVPAPRAGDQASFLRGDGQWAPAENTTYDPFSGAAAGKAGTAGLVPAPQAGDQASFLRGDGRWTRAETPTYTKDGQGQVTKIDFGNGLALIKGLDSKSYGWRIEVADNVDDTDYKTALWLGTTGAALHVLWPIEDGNINLGGSENRWSSIYSAEGEIQTSDRSEKTDIHYLADPVEAISDPHSDDSPDYDGSPAPADEITYADIEDFVRSLSAATFVYKSGIKEGVVDPAAVQLGLIADDICDHKLYPYIGTSHQTTEGVKRGLQPIPLAVAALVMCQRQADQIAELTQRIAKLEATK